MKIHIMRAIFFICAVVTALMIFSFSADNGEESGDLSGEITDKVLDVVGINPIDTPQKYKEVRDGTEHFIRKLAHFSEYAVFGLFVCLFFRTFPIRLWLVYLISQATATSYASLDEWHQLSVPGRAGSPIDVLIDSAGACCGIFAALALWYLVCRLIQKSKVI